MPAPSHESAEARWVPASEVLSFVMDRSMRIRIRISDCLRGDSPASW